MKIISYVKTLNKEQLVKEFNELDEIITQGNCFGIQDLSLHKAMMEEVGKRGFCTKDGIFENCEYCNKLVLAGEGPCDTCFEK